MALESCMILLDCSEYMRNGDYVPTRLEAQKDAANLLVGAKTQMNPETSVGVSAGTELLLSPTADVGKILGAIHGLQYQPSPVPKQQPVAPPGGGGKPSAAADPQSNITSAVQVASLALKHRPNKNGAQRIVLFVGTPVTADARALQKAGRALKKNNIAIDVVALGELEENEAKLRELVDAANGSSGGGDGQARTCHLVTIPPGGGVLVSDVLASSPILGQGAFAASAAAASMSMGAGGVGVGGGGGGMNDFAEYGGVDPSLDPELAMALRVSMEEERLRQERIAAAAAAAQQQQAEESKDADMDEAAAAAGLSEEEALLQQALAMSMNENEPTSAEEEDGKPAATEDVEMEDDDEDEDAAMQMALQMSLQQQEPASEFQDPNFINQMLGSMPGVDPNDPEIREALRKAQEKKEEDSGDKDESK